MINDDDLAIFDEPVRKKSNPPAKKEKSLAVSTIMRDIHTSVVPVDSELIGIPGELNKRLLASEMLDCDTYLTNIHRSFASVTSISQIIDLVGCALNVHKHRRQLLKVASEMDLTDNNSLTLSKLSDKYDVYGNKL